MQGTRRSAALPGYNAPVTSILTTVVGSYPVPSWLPHARDREALRDATLAVLKIQENAGIDVISDGELSRFDVQHPETNGMIDYFLAPMSGIDVRPTREDIAEFRRGEIARYRSEPAAILREPIGEGTLNLQRDWESVRGLTRHRLKFTCTGPHMLAKVVVDRHYRDLSRLTLEIAEILRKQIEAIDAPVIQLDEANISGHPDEGPWAAEALNRVLSAVRGEKHVHVCFGNYAGQTVQKGHWSKLVAYLNAIEADCLILECAHRPEEELRALKEIDPKIGLGIGVIDVKTNHVESPEEIAASIERAETLLGSERIRYVHPDCGFWMLKRSVADRKMESLVRGRDLFAGRRRGN
jgi:5-methyltetrahydropteroyltriglutamate--homocysteine methyltransferase